MAHRRLPTGRGARSGQRRGVGWAPVVCDPLGSAHGGLPLTKHIFVTGGVASSLGQGDHRLLARAAAEVAGPAGHDAEARPLHQRRPGHHEPVRARRGVRHRRRGRDRPRPRPLRAVHRREPHPRLERHHRLDLLGGARRRAARRLPRQDRAGDPAHHRRDQAAHQPPRRPTRSTSSSPRSAARSATSRSSRSSRRSGSSGSTSAATTSATSTSPWRPHDRRRAEDEAHPALRHRAAEPGHPARRHRRAQRAAARPRA